MANAKSQSGESKSVDRTLQKYLRWFHDSWDYAQQNYHSRWERNWKLYNNIRTQKNHPGKVEAFVPMVNSTVNTIVAALFNSVPSVKYLPNNREQEKDTAVLNDIYLDNARRDGWVRKNKINGRQGLITGNYCAYYEWDSDKNGGYVHKTIVPIRDMIIDPSATNSETWRYVGRRIFTSLKALKQEKIYDFEKQKYVPRYKNLELVTPGGESDRESDKMRKDQAIGSIAPGNKDSVVLYEIWTRKEVVVIANESVIIEQRENPHYAMEKSKFEQRKLDWELTRAMTMNTEGRDIGEFPEEFNERDAGLLPFAHGCDYEDISLVYGSSDVDIIANEQELLNTLTELNVESILYQLFPTATLDPRYAGSIDTLSPAPGKVYSLPQGALTWNTPPTIPANAFNERLNIKSEIREVSAVSEISKGVSATDNTTATEIKAMLGQADLRVQDKAQTMAEGFFFYEAKIFLKMLQLYAPDTLWVRNVEDAGVTFDEVDMTKFLGDYTPMVTLDITKQLEDAEKREAALSAFQMMLADPSNNLINMKRIMYPKIVPQLSQEEIAQIIEQPQQSAPETTGNLPPVEGGMEEIPPTGDLNPGMIMEEVSNVD